MFKRLPIITASFISSVTGWVLLTQTAFAAGTGGTQDVSLFGFSVFDFLNYVVGFVASTALFIMHYWVAITGALFSVSVNLTLHIKDFVDNTQGIYLVWQTIRDISGIFIIFMLLYASIRIILGYDEKIGSLIKNIVIAGILINFSFFITSLLIDASNIVSLAIYKGIVATPPVTLTQTSNIATLARDSINGTDNSLSDIFMDKLSLQSVYNPANLQLANTDSGEVAAPLKTLIQGVVGCVLMFTVGMSFLIASIAFVIRLLTLIILLAFSPFWFASWILPSLKESSDDFTKRLKSQLIFMPVYMLLLYAALLVLNHSGTIFSNSTGAAVVGSSEWITGLVTLAINDFFIVLLLNLPLYVGLTMGGHLSGMIKKFDATKIWKDIGLGTASYAGRGTLGRAAYAINESKPMRSLIAASPTIGGIASKQFGKLGNAGFGVKKGGYKDTLDAKKKAQESLYKHMSDTSTGVITDTEKLELQKKFRENLPWKNIRAGGGIVGNLEELSDSWLAIVQTLKLKAS